jgi:hypothetical protein
MREAERRNVEMWRCGNGRPRISYGNKDMFFDY